MANIVNVLAPVEGLQRKSAEEVRAWSVHFGAAESAFGIGGPVHRIREPQVTLAAREPIDLARALAEPRARDGDTTLTLLWLPGSAASGALEDEAQAWLGVPEEREIVRAGIRTVRVAWTSDRCIVFAPAEQFGEALDAVLRFTLAKRLMNSLEARMLDVWADLDGDVPLSHNVRSWQFGTQKRIDARTERITRINAEYLRLQKALEQLDVSLGSASKRLYAELVLQATIYDRMEAMEDPLEFAMDHYELVNTRLIESRNAGIERWTGIAIIALLALETILRFTGHG